MYSEVHYDFPSSAAEEKMPNPWKSSLHIPFIFGIQVVFLILFGVFSRYDPKLAMRNNFHGDAAHSIEHSNDVMGKTYAMFQDVHVMIFIGFGFLMTFLKKYGLSAVSLNMLCSVLGIQWSILVHGFLHPHCEDPRVEWGECPGSGRYIDINIITLLSADFATAAVLISFGVILGTTNPLQLLFMTFVEIVMFNVNEYIGRNLIGAVDAGDTIFVHMFGAYFGLAVSRMLYHGSVVESEKAAANYTSDLFSMIGTIFLWMFWPSFNGGAAAEGDAQMRAVINTYLSLCSCVMASFAASAFFSPERKFCMEHIQNATLAGGVAVGATADMVVTPFGALVIGAIAGVLSTWGFAYVSPFLAEKFKITDTCGVNNLHGMPSLFGGLLSVLLAGVASSGVYDQFTGDLPETSLLEIFPETATHSTGWQAGQQMLAIVVTLVFAVIGGLITGWMMKKLGQITAMSKRGMTVARLVLNVGNITTGSVVGNKFALSPDLLFDDNAYFHVEA